MVGVGPCRVPRSTCRTPPPNMFVARTFVYRWACTGTEGLVPSGNTYRTAAGRGSSQGKKQEVPRGAGALEACSHHELLLAAAVALIDADASSSLPASFANSTPLLPASRCWSSLKCEPAWYRRGPVGGQICLGPGATHMRAAGWARVGHLVGGASSRPWQVQKAPLSLHGGPWLAASRAGTARVGAARRGKRCPRGREHCARHSPPTCSQCTMDAKCRWQARQMMRNRVHMPNMVDSGKELTCRAGRQGGRGATQPTLSHPQPRRPPPLAAWGCVCW